MKAVSAKLIAQKKFDFFEEEIPALKPNEVLFKTISMGLCHSDMPAYLGLNTTGLNSRGYSVRIPNIEYPCGIGHEPICVVEAVGRDVKDFKEGDYATGFIRKCLSTHNIQPEKCRMRKIPETDKEIESFLGEPLMCVTSIVRQCDVRLGDRAAVVGCGFMGLMVIAGLCAKGVSVTAIDLDNDRLAVAKQCGASEVINPKETDVEGYVFDTTQGRMFDCVVEITGSLKGLKTALSITKIKGRGKLVIASVYTKEEVFDIDMAHYIMFRAHDIKTTQLESDEDAQKCLEIGMNLYAKGVFPMDKLITHRFPFEKTAEGFDTLYRNEGGYIKGLISF